MIIWLRVLADSRPLAAVRLPFRQLGAAGIKVHHFVLHADRETLAARIDSDTLEFGARQWRHDHVPL